MFRTALFALFAVCLGFAPARAQQIDTAATSAILLDMSSGAVLMSKDPNKRIPPASMSKLMTVYMVFEALADGRLKLDDEFVVSEKAWRMGGSKMFVKVNTRITIDNLLRGIIVQSGNDACVVVAEGMAGTEAAFARKMTEKARELGLKHSTFENATGLPGENHLMSVGDLAKLATIIIERFPEYYAIYSQRTFTWEGIEQRNRNPLLRTDMGADGMKTGYTEEAGYCIVGSAIQNERRLVLVVAGLPSAQARAVEAERILKWGFREFETTKLLAEGAEVGRADVWIGAESHVPLVVEKPIVVTTAFGRGEETTAKIEYDGPVPAPIAKGDRIATLVISAPDVEPIEVPLLAGADVAKGGFGKKLMGAAEQWVNKGLDAALGNNATPATE